MNKLILGIDIGGTKMSSVVWNGKAASHTITVQTAKNLKVFKYRLYELVKLMKSRHGISAVGVACAGVINPGDGVVLHSPNLKFLDGFNFKTFFWKELGIKNLAVDNDVQCFTLAEMEVGQGKKFKNFVGLMFGTGIGGGIVIGKKLYRGAHHSGAEFGHLVSGEGKTLESLYQRERDKGEFVKMGKVLGMVAANVQNALDPESIVLGGTITSQLHKKFLPALKSEVLRYLLNKKVRPNIVVSKLKDAAAIGAALLVK